MNPLGDLIARLVAGNVEFVMVGGYAAVVYGATYVTRDIDVCLRFTPENLMKLQRALTDFAPRHRMTPQKLPLDLTPEFAADLKNLYLETNLGVIDCLGEVLGIGDFDAVLANSTEMRFPFGACRVLTIDALIKAKQAMGRPHDLLTIKQLEAIRRANPASSG